MSVMLKFFLATIAMAVLPVVIIVPCMLIIQRLEKKGYHVYSKLLTLLTLSPFIIIGINAALPDQLGNALSWAVIVLAIVYCVLLSNAGMKVATLCSIPALICVISGLDGAHDFVRYGVGTTSQLVDKFCYFICGIWCLYFMVKAQEKK